MVSDFQLRKKGRFLDTIGEKLKKARIDKGLTIGDLQRITKIQRHYLEAIERNDFNAIPSDYYLRTFITQYAEVVDLNPRPLLRRFEGKPSVDSHLAPAVPVQGSRRVKYGHTANKRHVMKTYIPIVLLTITVVAIVATIGFAMWQDAKSGPLVPKPEKTTVMNQSTQTTSSTSSQETKETSSQTKETKEKETKKPEFKITEDTGNAITYDIYNVEKPAITLTGVNATVWFGLQETGAADLYYQNTIQAGESIQAEIPQGVTSVDVVVGAPNYLSLSVDGHDLKFNETQPITGKKVITLNFISDADKQTDSKPNEE